MSQLIVGVGFGRFYNLMFDCSLVQGAGLCTGGYGIRDRAIALFKETFVILLVTGNSFYACPYPQSIAISVGIISWLR